MDYKIKCADCGIEHTAKRKHAKYCGVCRLFRDLAFLGHRKTKCWDCGETFAQLQTNDNLCGKCDFISRSHYRQGTCSLCKAAQATLIRSDVAVCLQCAKDPARRNVFAVAVSKKRRAQRAANGGTA